MDTKDVNYLNSSDNHAQYPAAWCDMGKNIYMYCHSASSVVEGMNAVNKQLRTRMVVDLLNASLLLIKMECKQFAKQKHEAWGSNSILTHHGAEEYDSTFQSLHPSMYKNSCTD